MRRLKSGKRTKVAVKVGTGKIVIIYYDALTKGAEDVESGTEKYLEQIKRNEIRLMNKLAVKHNFMICSA